MRSLGAARLPGTGSLSLSPRSTGFQPVCLSGSRRSLCLGGERPRPRYAGCGVCWRFIPRLTAFNRPATSPPAAPALGVVPPLSTRDGCALSKQASRIDPLGRATLMLELILLPASLQRSDFVRLIGGRSSTPFCFFLYLTSPANQCNGRVAQNHSRDWLKPPAQMG